MNNIKMVLIRERPITKQDIIFLQSNRPRLVNTVTLRLARVLLKDSLYNISRRQFGYISKALKNVSMPGASGSHL
jgi:hypothetical protein